MYLILNTFKVFPKKVHNMKTHCKRKRTQKDMVPLLTAWQYSIIDTTEINYERVTPAFLLFNT